MVLPFRRTGVPVFMRNVEKPFSFSCSVMPYDAGSAMRPPAICVLPMCIKPPKKVPAVNTTHVALNSICMAVTQPTTLSPSNFSFTTESCQTCKFGVASIISRHLAIYFNLSLCERGLHMAGPFERLSIRNCTAVASVTMPIKPPRASISLTI